MGAVPDLSRLARLSHSVAPTSGTIELPSAPTYAADDDAWAVVFTLPGDSTTTMVYNEDAHWIIQRIAEMADEAEKRAVHLRGMLIRPLPSILSDKWVDDWDVNKSWYEYEATIALTTNDSKSLSIVLRVGHLVERCNTCEKAGDPYFVPLVQVHRYGSKHTQEPWVDLTIVSKNSFEPTNAAEVAQELSTEAARRRAEKDRMYTEWQIKKK